MSRRKLEIIDVPVVTPTWAEFNDPDRYIRKLYYEYGDLYPFVRVIPPAGYSFKNNGLFDYEHSLVTPVEQTLTPQSTPKTFKLSLRDKTEVKLKKFYSFGRNFRQPCEKDLWKTMGTRPRLYVHGIPDSYMGKKLTKPEWQLSELIGHLNDSLVARKGHVKGVTTPYVFIAHRYSVFCLHVEDYNFFSISALLRGPGQKVWYGIHPRDADKVRALITELYPSDCHNYMMHKSILIDPQVFLDHDIQIYRAFHSQGEFIVTFPKGQHFGANLEECVAEAINYCLLECLPISMEYIPCSCPDIKTTLRFTSDEFYNFFVKGFEEEIRRHTQNYENYTKEAGKESQLLIKSKLKVCICYYGSYSPVEFLRHQALCSTYRKALDDRFKELMARKIVHVKKCI